jgi:hypothetical protein
MVAQFKLGRILRLPELGKEKRKEDKRLRGKQPINLMQAKKKLNPYKVSLKIQGFEISARKAVINQVARTKS